jgi:putative flippase GtrA
VKRHATRIGAGMRLPANWFQLARFACVGASGFVVNIVLFALLVHGFSTPYLLAALISNVLALCSNFLLNRTWTFRASHGRAAMQAPRFALVSVSGFVINLLVLRIAVELLAFGKLPAEVLASAVAAPVNFLGSRMWAFSTARRRGIAPASARP